MCNKKHKKNAFQSKMHSNKHTCERYFLGIFLPLLSNCCLCRWLFKQKKEKVSENINPPKKKTLTVGVGSFSQFTNERWSDKIATLLSGEFYFFVCLNIFSNDFAKTLNKKKETKLINKVRKTLVLWEVFFFVYLVNWIKFLAKEKKIICKAVSKWKL